MDGTEEYAIVKVMTNSVNPNCGGVDEDDFRNAVRALLNHGYTITKGERNAGSNSKS